MTTVDLGRLPRGQDGQLVIGNTGKSPLWKTVSGDAILSSSGVLTLSALAAFSANKNGTNQTGLGDNTVVQVTFTEVYDVGAHFASSAWTPPAGKIHLSAGMITQAIGGAATGWIAIYIYKNGGPLYRTLGPPLLVGSPFCGASISIDDIANGTDVYTVYAHTNNVGGTTTILGATSDTWFMGHWISA